MAQVLVIAKSAEFENADYLDIRPLLSAAKVTDYKIVELFDVAGLRGSLPEAKLVILTSGVLGDESFVASLQGELKSEWGEVVRGPASILILSQLLFAARGIDLPGFDRDLAVQPVVRPPREPKDAGELTPTIEALDSQVSWLPVSVDYQRLNKIALDSSLQGLYWHWWRPASPELWQTILFDAKQEHVRPLVVQHLKGPKGARVILSAVALDRIRDEQLLVNLIQLCLGGEFGIGYVVHEPDSIESGLVVSSIRRVDERVMTYQIDQDDQLQSLASALEHGVHQTLVIARDVPIDRLSGVADLVARRVSNGSLQTVKLQDFSADDHMLTLKLSSMESYREFRDLAAEVVWVLSGGLIGQSIFDTAHVMHAVLLADSDAFKIQNWAVLTEQLLGRLRRDGTFEGPPVPTAAFVYVTSVILHSTQSPALVKAQQKAVKWLETVFESESLSNQLRIAIHLSRAGRASPELAALFSKSFHQVKPADESSQVQLYWLELAVDQVETKKALEALTLLLSLDSSESSLVSAQPSEFLSVLLSARRMLLGEMDAGRVDLADLLDQTNRMITRLADQVFQAQLPSVSPQSLPSRVRSAAALDRYLRSIAVPTSPLIKILTGSRRDIVDEQRWSEAVEFSARASASMKAAQAREEKLRSALGRLRYEQRFSRLVILILALLASMSALFLFFAIEPEFSEFPMIWEEFTANWGFVSGFITFLVPFAAWAFLAFRAKPRDDDEGAE